MSGRCQVEAFPRVDRDELIRGFSVPEFELRPSSERPGAFEWTAPEHALRVVCALFTSVPEFSEPRDGDRHALIRMTNAGRAIERRRVFNAKASGPERHFSFEIADLEPESSCDTPLNLLESRRYAVVDLLRLACWAFDGARVMAATRLVEIAPSALPDFDTTPQPNCQSQLDGTWCSMPGTPGACARQRCDTTKSLPDPEPTPDSANGGAAGASSSEPPAPVTSCAGVKEDSTVRCVVPSEVVGQCLHSECISATSDDYRPPLVVSNCSAEGAEGLNCFPSPLFAFGSCGAGTCLPRCWNDADCNGAYERAGLMKPGLYCDRRPTAYIGICKTQ